MVSGGAGWFLAVLGVVSPPLSSPDVCLGKAAHCHSALTPPRTPHRGGKEGRTACGVPGREGRLSPPAAPSRARAAQRRARSPCPRTRSRTHAGVAGHTGGAWSSWGRHKARGQARELGRTQQAHVSLPTCSPLPSRTPPWRRTCQPPGAGSPARSPCLSPSSPPPSAPAPGRAARLPGDGDKDAEHCSEPPRSSALTP